MIQNVDLTWYKNERGGKGAAIRRQFPTAYQLDETPLSGAAVVHHLSFYQTGTRFLDSTQAIRQSLEEYLPKIGFTPAQTRQEIQQRLSWIKRHQFQIFSCVEDLNLTNLSIHSMPEGLSVSFFYDEQRSGMPFRRGHNQDYHDPNAPLYGKDCLNETAFVLSPGQYGQIVWNERGTDPDDRTWYYQLHICNLFHIPSETAVQKDIFLSRKPDFVYKQLAVLY